MQTTHIEIEDLRVKCLIGVWKHERQCPQELRVDVSVAIDGRTPARSDTLESTFNYASIAEQISFILEEGRFKLLETACWMIQRWLLLVGPRTDGQSIVQSVQVRLRKFGALPGQAVASVQSRSHAGERTFEQETKSWGSVDIVAESQHLGLYRLNISPGCTLPSHFHKVMRESELVLNEGLALREHDQAWRRLTPGERFRWPHGYVHGYRNEGSAMASLLCMDAPTFNPEDEILATVAP